MDLSELMKKKENLCPELRRHLHHGFMGLQISHPLVHEILYTPQLNAYYNKRLVLKKRAIREGVKNKEWSHVIWMHERPYRLRAFNKWHKQFTLQTYWSLLSQIWMDSENIWQDKDLWTLSLFATRSGTKHFMDKSEQHVFKKLPKQFVVYRGYLEKNRDGLSWTLSKQVAEKFANRWSGINGAVRIATVNKADVMAYISRRGEEEIILKPWVEVREGTHLTKIKYGEKAIHPKE